MITIQVLGSGCPNCKRLEKIAKEAVESLGVEGEVVKVTDFNKIADLGVMSTPGLIINGKIASTGRVPAQEEVADWIQEALKAA